MRLALFSDIHGNSTGLRAVLAQIQKMGGVDAIYALGDHVGLGAATDEIFDLLLQNQAHMLRGNWEELIFDIESHVSKTTNHELVRRAAAWTYAHLSGPYWDLLKGLPIHETVEIAPEIKLFACHAAPNDTWPWTCQPDIPTPKLRQVYGALDAQIIAYGHYHRHHVLALDGKLLLNVASVGLREDGLSGLTILDYDGHLSIQQLQVPYDVAEEKRLNKEYAVPI
ncbi:MAG: metallophosphoesterase family protein [Anaerolineales bacterium]|nr:metallophosphoesterase family protein [Anaerolineales bacterium]